MTGVFSTSNRTRVVARRRDEFAAMGTFKNLFTLYHWLLPCILVFSSHAALANDERDEPNATESNVDVEFAQAVRRFKEGDYVAALEGFTSLKRRTHSPNVQLYVGYCYVRLGRPADAYRAFTLTLEQTSSPDSRYEATRNAAREQLASLDSKLSKITISLVKPSPEARVLLDGRPLELAELNSPITVEPGVHVVEAEAPGMQPEVRSIALEKATNKTVALFLQPQSARAQAAGATNDRSGARGSPNMTTLGWVAAGVGFAGFGLFTAAGLRAKSIYESLQEQCANRCADAAHREQASSGRAWQTTANVGLTVGILSTVTAVTFFGLGAANRSDRQSTAGLELGSHFARFTYAGSF